MAVGGKLEGSVLECCIATAPMRAAALACPAKLQPMQPILCKHRRMLMPIPLGRGAADHEILLHCTGALSAGAGGFGGRPGTFMAAPELVSASTSMFTLKGGLKL